MTKWVISRASQVLIEAFASYLVAKIWGVSILKYISVAFYTHGLAAGEQPIAHKVFVALNSAIL